MQNYERLIIDALPGDTPKEKHDWLQRFMTLIEEKDKEIAKLRSLFASCYCGALLYSDDGELQDNRTTPFIDFKRDSLEDIEIKLHERAIRSLEEQPL